MLLTPLMDNLQTAGYPSPADVIHLFIIRAIAPVVAGTRPGEMRARGKPKSLFRLLDINTVKHCLRLYLEFAELMREGRITLPRPERDLLIQVRQGGYTRERFEQLCLQLRTQAEQAALASPLPDAINHRLISRLIAEVHRDEWLRQDANATAGGSAGPETELYTLAPL